MTFTGYRRHLIYWFSYIISVKLNVIWKSFHSEKNRRSVLEDNFAPDGQLEKKNKIKHFVSVISRIPQDILTNNVSNLVCIVLMLRIFQNLESL